MKRLLIYVFFFLAGTNLLYAQNAMFDSGAFSPSTIAVGETSNLRIMIGAMNGIGSYEPGELKVGVSFPKYFFMSPNPPQGQGYNWVLNEEGDTWFGTNTQVISTVELFTFQVTGINPTVNGPEDIIVNVMPQGANDLVPGDNSGKATLVVTQATNTISITPSVTTPVAPGVSVTFTASGCTGGTYTWTPLGGTASGTGNNTYSIAQNVPGAYTVTATCSTGGSANVPMTVQQNDIQVTNPNPSVPAGTSVTLTASGCTGGTITWSPTGGTVGNGGTTYTVIAGQGATNYTATCSTGGSGTSTVTGTVNTITVTNPNPSVPAGTSVTLMASGCTGGTITWTPTGGTTGNGGTTYTVEAGQGATNYTATCSTGGSGSSTVTGTVNTITVNSSTTGPVNVGTSVTLTASGCTNGTYTWSPTGGQASGTGNNTYVINALSGSTNYTATCSTGGVSNPVTITGQTVQTCQANAGVLN